MKNIVRLSAFLVFFLAAPSLFADAGFLKKLEKRGFPRLKTPRVRVEVLDNGMRCFLMEDHTLPVVKMKMITRVGSIYDPGDKVGLASLAGMNMRSGGAGELPPEDFDAAVDDIGAVIASGIGHEMGSASLAVLSEDLEEGAKLLIDMLLKPRFDEKRLAVDRLKLEESLRRDRDNPNEYVQILGSQLVYGKDSPWARRPDEKGLSNIKSSDLRRLHEKYFRTDNMLFTASGDFDSDRLLELIGRLMKDAPRGEVEFPPVPWTELEFKPEVKRVFAELSQAFVDMGHLGVKRHNPDWFALYVMSDILGEQNFKSRLMEDIRTRRGLVYSIRAKMTQGTDYGLFFVRFSTKAGQEDSVVNLVREHIRKLSNDGDLTEDELDFSKRSILANAIFDLDSPFKIVNDRARFHFYGYPPDYWKVSYDGISAVTGQDVTRAAKKYLHPDGLKVLILGPRR